MFCTRVSTAPPSTVGTGSLVGSIIHIFFI
jgi:hypothetical protein